MTKGWLNWTPAVVLLAGAVMTNGLAAPPGHPLRLALADALPRQIAGYAGTDFEIGQEELRAAGVSNYLYRTYAGGPGHSVSGFTLYVGYYDDQSAGKTIHSPKNCLPGSGWEALQSSTIVIETPSGAFSVNRYLIQKDTDQALVLYWYQGRGRRQANEYAVKWNLLLDASLRRRSEEALVRIVVPLAADQSQALDLATSVAASIAQSLGDALPS